MSRYFDSRISGEENSFIRGNLQILRDYCLRSGKRIRPLLVIAAYQGYASGPVTAGIVDVAAAAEVCHASFLVHDDIIDKADTRRGQPSLDRLLQTRLSASNSRTVGYDEGIVFGDILIFASMDLVASADIDPVVKAAVMKESMSTYLKTCWGQALDIFYSKPASVSAQDDAPGAICEMKTAYYTVAGPLLTGLRLSGKYTDAEAEKILRAALPLGRAFQIRDDLLGVFGDEASIGKSPDSDLAEGKYTLLVQRAVSSLSDSDTPEFLRLFSAQQSSADDISKMRAFIVRSGAKTWCIKEALDCIAASRIHIAELSMYGENRDILYGLCDVVSDVACLTD